MSQRKGRAEGSDREFERQREEKRRDLSLLTSPTLLCEQKEILASRVGKKAGKKSDILSSSAQDISLAREYLPREARAFCHNWNGSSYHLVKINPIMNPSTLKYCNKIK